MSSGKIHKKTKIKCLICEEKTDIILHKTRRQTHSLCVNCGKNYLIPKLIKNTNNIILNIRDNMDKIKCPGSVYGAHKNMCEKYINIRHIKSKKNSEIDTYIFRILYTLDNPNCFICPNKKCGNIVETNLFSFSTFISCKECNITWCKNCCVTPYHENLSCIEYDLTKNDSKDSKYILELNKENKLKFCPQCKIPIIKNKGCNKIVCENCNMKWCWLCEEINIDYSHYNIKNNTKCANKLWI